MAELADMPDWRLQGQDAYLKAVTLWWRTYTPPNEIWGRDHCEFCWNIFAAGDVADAQHEGYATTPANDTPGGRRASAWGSGLDPERSASEVPVRWICRQCYEDFKGRFAWQVATDF